MWCRVTSGWGKLMERWMTNSSSHVKTGRMPFWKDKFKGREGGKNLCVAIVILLTESVPEIPNLRSPLIPFFPILCLGATQGHCPFGPWKRLWLLASSIDPQRSVAVQFSSVQSLSHVRLFATPCTAAGQTSLSVTNSRVHPNPCPLSRWCHPTISSSVVPFSSCPQSFPASGSFPMSQLFASGGQIIGASASASIFPMNIQG